MSKKSKSKKKKPTSEDLKRLRSTRKDSLKDENPFRKFSRLPRPSDLRHDNWRKAAEVYLKQNPDDIRKACWKGLSLSDHAGSANRKDANYDTHHWSLMACVSNALIFNMVDPDLNDPNTKGFKDHMVNQYDHDNPEAQFQSAWNNIISMSREELYEKFLDNSDGKSTKAKHDSKLLERFSRLTIENLTVTSPVPMEKMEKLTPFNFLRQVYTKESREISAPNTKKSKLGNVCIGEKVTMSLLVNPDDQTLIHPWSKKEIDNIDSFLFFSRSLFKENTEEGGSRSKLNLAKEHLIVAEADFTLYNGLVDEVKMERFNNVMHIASQFGPLLYIIYSGGKSYHFGFVKGDIDAKSYQRLQTQFIQLGADPTVIRDATKYVRLPNVEPEEGSGRRRQELLYFDPKQVDPLKGKKWDVEGFIEEIDNHKSLDSWHKDGSFFVKDQQGDWRKTQSIEDHLAEAGFSTDTIIGDNVSAVKKAKIKIERENSVDEVVAALGGYDAGCYTLSGRRVLVRSSRKFPKILKNRGPFDKIENFLRELFDENELQIFLGWLADGVRCNYNNGEPVAKMSPSQMMHIVGESNCGKTALTDLVLRQLFCDRMVNGSGLFSEKDDIFNSMEKSSELLTIDDKSSLKATEANRDHQSETLKSILVSGTDEIHGKGVNKISAKSFKRIIRCMNYDKINTLPKINSPEVGDKVIVLKAFARGEAKSTKWFNDMSKAMIVEIPNFFNYLLKEHEVPSEYRISEEDGERFPVVSYHNAEIVAELNEGSNSAQLRELILQGNLPTNIERGGVRYYEGTSMEVYNEIRSNLRGDDLDRFKKLFSNPDRLLQALRELRIISRDDDTQTVLYSAKDSITPQVIDGGNKYWRIGGAIREPKKKSVKDFF